MERFLRVSIRKISAAALIGVSAACLVIGRDGRSQQTAYAGPLQSPGAPACATPMRLAANGQSKTPRDSPEAQIKKMQDQWRPYLEAGRFGDLRQLFERWTTPDFTFRRITGESSPKAPGPRAEALDQLISREQQSLSSVRNSQAHFEKDYNVKLHLKIRFSSQSLKIQGDTATEHLLLTYWLPVNAHKTLSNGMVQFEGGNLGYSEPNQIQWIKTPEGWRIRSMEILPFGMMGTALSIKQPDPPRSDPRKHE